MLCSDIGFFENSETIFFTMFSGQFGIELLTGIQINFSCDLSKQKTHTFGTAEVVKAESEKLLKAGLNGSYNFSPSHSVESVTWLKNIPAFILAFK
jgi:hypothetical protein